MTSEILKRLRRTFRLRKARTALEYLDLAPEQQAALERLRVSEDWPVFLEALARLYEQNAFPMLRGVSQEQYWFACGILEGIKRISTLLDDLKRIREQKDDREHRRTDADATEREWRRAIHNNTPWWTGYSVPTGANTRDPGILTKP